MRAVVITKHGPPEVLQVQERPAPDRPLGGQVAIDVAAAGINFADTMARVGLYPDAPKPPTVVGYEVAGTVRAVGPGVEGLEAGQRVMAGTRFGGYAEQIVVKAADVVPLPDELSFEQGAAIPVNYTTAWAGLIRYGTLQPGERVLIHAAAGGVGISATQIAKRSGAEVYGTASPGKHDACRGFGVDHAIDYTTPGWPDEVRALTGGRGVDVAVDHVGRSAFPGALRALANRGRLVICGASSGPEATIDLVDVFARQVSIIGSSDGSRRELVEVFRLLAEGRVPSPPISAELPLERAVDAQALLASRDHYGRVLLTPGV